MAAALVSRSRAAAYLLRLRGEGVSNQWSAHREWGARRHIRTGYFPEDDDYIDPERPLLAARLGERWRHMDDPSLQAPVLERNNVGMGMLVLNRPDGLDLPAVNTAYTRLRNLEVNTFKRFVGLTAREPGAFCNGVHPRELLLAAAAGARRGDRGELPHFSRALLWHHQELAHLVADYRKPLVCFLSGSARNGGAALACLSNFSGASDVSEVVVDACSIGLVPDGGMTFVLGQLRWHLGEFLALTGTKVCGADLIYCELLQHWLSPEALPFLELTADKQLEVSETDARALLDEHSLPVPEVSREEFLSRFNLPLINKAFSGDTVDIIKIELKQMQRSGKGDEKAFAEDCLRRMSKACPLAMAATLRLIRDARSARVRKIHSEAANRGGAPKPPRQNNARKWQAPGFISEFAPGSRGQEEEDLLVRALRLELRAQQRLLRRPDAVRALHAKCVGSELSPSDWDAVGDDVEPMVEELLREADPEHDTDNLVDFSISPRSEMTLSQHPLLRRYHPDYDPVTKTDHDPDWMAAEARRWSPDFFEEQRMTVIEDLLDGADPAMYGFSRWVRPGSRSVAKPT